MSYDAGSPDHEKELRTNYEHRKTKEALRAVGEKMHRLAKCMMDATVAANRIVEMLAEIQSIIQEAEGAQKGNDDDWRTPKRFR